MDLFGAPPQTAESSVDGIRRQTTAGFTLLEFVASPPPPNRSIPQEARGAPAAETSKAAEWTNCTIFASPPARPSLSASTSQRRQLYWPIVREAECRHDLPHGLLDALVLTESQYQSGAISWAGAGGLTQLMPATAASLGVANRFNPTHNVDGGARYLSQMIRAFSGSVSLALAAYNAGPTAVKRSRGIPLNGETPRYVERVLRYWRELAGGSTAPPVSARRMAQMLGFLTQSPTPSSSSPFLIVAQGDR